MDQKTRDLVNRLTHWHWSPEFPTTYTLPNGSGLGKIAMNNPAAFNLAWARFKGDFGNHFEAVRYFSVVGTRLSAIHVNKQPLEVYATLLNYQDFSRLYSQIRPGVSNLIAEVIDEAFNEKV